MKPCFKEARKKPIPN